MTLLLGAGSGGVGSARDQRRERGDRRGVAGLWRNRQQPGKAFAAAVREVGGEHAPSAKHGKQTLRAGDEIALRAQAPTQPDTGNGAK